LAEEAGQIIIPSVLLATQGRLQLLKPIQALQPTEQLPCQQTVVGAASQLHLAISYSRKIERDKTMIRFALTSLCIIFLSYNRCLSQSNGAVQQVFNWGQSVQGVQFSTSVTTNVFQAGSSIVFESTLLNSSTNTFDIDTSSANGQLSIWLTDDTGGKYSLTPHHSVYLGPHPKVKVLPGDNIVEHTTAKFDSELKPGDYTLKAGRLFMLNKMPFVVEAKPVKVKIVE
jgi:hypothetical protein